MPRHALDDEDDDDVDVQLEEQGRRMSIDQQQPPLASGSGSGGPSSISNNPIIRQLARGSSLSARVGSSSDGLNPPSDGPIGQLTSEGDDGMRSSSVAPGSGVVGGDYVSAQAGPSSRRMTNGRLGPGAAMNDQHVDSKRSTTAQQGSTRVSGRAAAAAAAAAPNVGNRTAAAAGKQRRQRYAVDDDDDDEDEEGYHARGGGRGAGGGRGDVHMRDPAARYALDRDDDDDDQDGDLDVLPEGMEMDLAGSDGLFFPGETVDSVDDVRRLSRAWVRERGTQGLMRWQRELVESCLNKLEQQVHCTYPKYVGDD